MSEDNAKQIAELNDRFRLRFSFPCHEPEPPVPGLVVATRGVLSLPSETQVLIWETVRQFDKFTEDDDPHGEHDFGSFDVDGVSEKIFWKIDYYADSTVRSARKTPAIRPSRSASSPSCWQRSTQPSGRWLVGAVGIEPTTPKPAEGQAPSTA